MRLNLGSGVVLKDDYVNIDLVKTSPSTVVHDLNEGLHFVKDNTVDHVIAHHVLEHIRELDYLMQELHRVCLPGTTIDIIVPIGNTLWDVADPTHVRKFNHRTFEYYCEGFQTSYGRERMFKLRSTKVEREPNEWFQGIEWIVANLHVVLEVL